MSQVIITVDKLKSRRVKSGDKEHQIDREGLFNRWRLSDISGFDPVAATVGLAVLPIVASWYIIGFFVKFAIFIAIGVSRMVGTLLGNEK